MAEPGDGDAAMAFIRDAPVDALKALLGRLSPKCVLRMRVVCKAWYDKLSRRALLTGLHQSEPPRPLLCFDGYIQLKDNCVESLDLRSGKLRSVIRFTGNDFYGSDDNNDIEGRAGDADFRVDHETTEKNHGRGGAGAAFKFNPPHPQVTVHASLDGYLLVSFSTRRRWYIINPATRHWVSLFDPTGFHLRVIGFYEHGATGDYRALCIRDEAPNCTYHVITVRPGERRHIGHPLLPETEDHGLGYGVEKASISPPIQWKRTMDLLWPPQERQGYQMLVFDTATQKFSWKRPPPPVTMVGDQDMRLLEFPDDGNLGMSISRQNEATLELWRIQDYKNEVWDLKYRIQLALQQMPPAALRLLDDPWTPFVVSAEGDVLIEFRSRRGVLHCDRDGKLLRRFLFSQTKISQSVLLPIRHVLRKSLRHHPMFTRSKYDDVPPFFGWLCSL